MTAGIAPCDGRSRRSDANREAVASTGHRRSASSRTTGAAARIRLKRAYEPASRSDGTRVLVERLWPRGVSKQTLRVDAWPKDVGPSTGLRQWFSHDPDKWLRFRALYFRELDSRPEAWQPIVSAARRGTVTLVYSSRDAQHNNAVALRDYLQSKIRKRRGSV